ncbi:putative PTS system, N-acetylglucosamine-specific II ABC component [Mesoplasma florum W37]|uniref:PTS system N-acetylglucosamine-specific IIB component, PTS system N-acetylglucosamine-specific IIC component n=1 Tax=Mesoplasma florum TaxID=2151 RepID=A0AAD0HSD8_MESFO|nr:PTS transporter subunit EIIC [Mesoplasma florum]AGY41752.1 putative PTS system, N-acetylglucosamine-specific II ABC component [Mesoplasma florum W37]AVN59956.1 hypothetical protein CG008_03610 [Mesoplasma florum]AVN66091.1 PTS system N-acetylglucosamine-specific IIB component, PTS system N-acetylglucosamine-specific IIC component [Mesoplasma florum]
MLTQLKQKHSQSKNRKKNALNTSGGSKWNKILTKLQELGKALAFPIAVLPFAAILNRFGALGVTYTTDSTGAILDGVGSQIGYWISFIIQQPGQIVFDNLALLFAIGIAFGLSKDHRGEVALVSAVFYIALIALTSVERSLPSMIYGKTLGFDIYKPILDDAGKVIGVEVSGKLSGLFYVPINSTYEGANGELIKYVSDGAYVLNIGVLGGITAGCLSAFLYNKYKDIQLPQALSFFSGRRFVPMVALITVIPTALLFSLIWPWIQYVLMLFGRAVADPTNPAVAIPGTAIYAILNRLLLPFGLHNILNTFFWFQLPIQGHIIDPITGNAGAETIVNGDINAFAAGIEGSGLFQGGFFPVMMGGVPAIAIAMICTAKPENRKEIAGFLGGVALVSLVSGITEPIEFSFVFISPILLVIHALLAGVFVAISTGMQIQLGFGFSAGLIDYIASFAQSWGFAASKEGVFKITSNPLWVLLLTPIAFGTYFGIFYTTIKKLNLPTPGREENEVTVASKDKKQNNTKAEDKYQVMAEKIFEALGKDNIVSIDNCMTRLRLILKDNSKIDESKIKEAGSYGIKRMGTEAMQIVIGLDVVHVAEIMQKLHKKIS